MRASQFVVISTLLVAACSSSSNNEAGSAGAAGVSASSGAAGMNSGAAGTSSGGASGTAGGGAAGMSIGGSPSTASGGAGVSSAGATSTAGTTSTAGAPAAGGASSGAFAIAQLTDFNGCLSQALPVDTDSASPTFGQLTCLVVETSAAAACDCSMPARAAVSSSLATAVRKQIMAAGDCGASGQPACTSFCVCEISQEVGAAETKCEADPVVAASDPAVPPGFCYDADPTSPALANCPVGLQRKLLFVSPAADPTPASGSSVFLACP